jgi:uncharacterized protein with HEPN domain
MKSERVYLVHVLDCIARIERYTEGGRAAFMADPMMQDAVLRNIEVIGEAANNLPTEFRRLHSEVDWRRAIALRNVLIHNYMGVNIGRVWSDVSSTIPKLKLQIGAILEALPAEIPG